MPYSEPIQPWHRRLLIGRTEWNSLKTFPSEHGIAYPVQNDFVDRSTPLRPGPDFSPPADCDKVLFFRSFKGGSGTYENESGERRTVTYEDIESYWRELYHLELEGFTKLLDRTVNT